MHLSDDILINLKNGALSTAEEQEALLQIAECEICAGRFSELFDAEAEAPPKGFLECTEQRIKDRKREFLLYSARVMISVAASLVIVFTTAFPEYFSKAERWIKDAAEKKDAITQKIYERNDYFYENQEK